MKMKYLWDEWDGVCELPDNLYAFQMRNGEERRIGNFIWKGIANIGKSDRDVVLTCVAVPDLTGEEL
jgi:hypothetical protein